MSSKTFRTTERVYHYPGNGSAPVFVADKDTEIDYELAVRLGLVKQSESKKLKEADVEDKKAAAPATKKRTPSDKE